MTFQQMIEQVERAMSGTAVGFDAAWSMARTLVDGELTVPGATVSQLANAISMEWLPVLGCASWAHAIAVGLADRDLLPQGQVTR